MKSVDRWTFICAISLCAIGAPAASSFAQQKVNYEQHVLPLLRDKCLGCHNGEKSRGGLDASTYGKLMEGGSSGAVVKAGDADGSRLFALAAHKEEPKMPPNAPMIAKESLDLLKNWIEAGAPENAGSKAIKAEKKADAGLKTAVHGKPAVMPMPVALPQLQLPKTSRANAITALATSPWAPIAAVASPKQVLIYHTETLDLLGVLPFAHGQVNVLRFSRNGDLLLAAGGRGGKSGKAVLYEIKTGKILTEIGDETDAIQSADISADQSMVALGGSNRLVRVYSTADGSKLREQKKHTDWVTALEFSPDGVLLASADRNGGLIVWEAHTGREYFVLAGHKAGINDVSWRDDGNLLASCSDDTTVKTWEMNDGKQVKSFGAHGGGVQAVKFTHDGRLVTTGRDGRAKLFDANGTAQREYPGIPDLAMKVAATYDMARILAGDWSGLVLVWQAADGKKAGEVSSNPPTPAERLEIAKIEYKARVRVVEIAEGLFKEAQGQEQTLKAQLDNANKTLGETHKKHEAAKAQVETLKKAVADTEANLGNAARLESAAQLKFNALTAALNQIKAEATKAANDPSIAKAVADVQKTVDDANAELTKAKSEHMRLKGALPATKQQFDTAQKAVADGVTQIKSQQDQAGKCDQNHKQAPIKTAATKAVLDKAVTDRDAAKAALDKLAELQKKL